MKVSQQREGENFRPVTISLTLESKEELAMIKSIFQNVATIDIANAIELRTPNIKADKDRIQMFFTKMWNLTNTIF